VKTLLGVVALVVVAGSAGYLLATWGSDSAVSLGAPPRQTPSTQATQVTETLPTGRALEVYFVQNGRLVEALRGHTATRRVATAALRALLAGPNSAERAQGIGTEIPPTTRLLPDVSIANGVAKVDLTSDYESGAGSRSLQLRLAQVVYTLTQFPTVKRVRFEIDGSPVNVFSSSGIVLDHPVGRSAYESLAPLNKALPGKWRTLPPAPIGPLVGRSSAWTGHELLVLGRAGGPLLFASYDPPGNRWRRLAPPANAPPGPFHTVWAGDQLLAWGRLAYAYRPAGRSWLRLPRPPIGEPVVAVWTGRELVGWNRSGGAAYRPATNRWRRIAPAPFLGSAAWTGHELIMQSGDRATAFVPGRGWRLLASLPDPREGPTLVWDGHELLVVGGKKAPRVGFAYDPSTNQWRRLAAMDSGRARSAMVWTGTKLLLWGGETGVPGDFATPPHGLAYDPRADRWSPLPQAPLQGRLHPLAAWTGRSMVVWGGDPDFTDGALFQPAG
jgi:Sporulation and spore germination/Kelch motif